MEGLPPKETTRLIRALTLVSIFLGAYLFYFYVMPALASIFSWLIPLVLPFIIALILAAALEPVVILLQVKGRMSRRVASLIAILLVLAIVIGLLSLFISRLIIELVGISASVPEVVQVISNYLWNLFMQVKEAFIAVDLSADMVKGLQGLLEQASQGLTSATTSSVLFFINIIKFLPGAFIVLLFTFLSAYYFSSEKDNLRRTLYRGFSPLWHQRFDSLGREASIALVGFLRAAVVLMLITMFVSLLGLWFLQVKFAFTAALLVGIFDMLPVLGPGMVFAPWGLWMLIQGDVRFAVELFVLWAVVSIIRQVLQPKVVSGAIGLHPVETLITIFVGLKLFGVLGLVTGPGLLVIGKAAWHAGFFNRNQK